MNKFFTLLFVAATVSFSSCSSDDSSANNNSSGNGLKVNINGQPYDADRITAVQSFGGISIDTRNRNGEKTVMLYIPNHNVGVYTDAMISCALAPMSPVYVNQDASRQRNGSVTITSLSNNVISGYFNCTAYQLTEAEPIVLSNGIFQNIPLTIDIDPMGEGYYSAIVNEVTYNFKNAVAGKSNGRITISGLGTSDLLVIDIPENTALGTYTVQNNQEGIFAKMKKSGFNSSWYPVTGTLTITGINSDWIDGTFTLSGIDDQGNEKIITGGQFHAPLVEIN